MTRRNKAPQTRKTRSTPLPPSLLELPVVLRCRNTFEVAYNEALQAGKSTIAATDAAEESYRTSMPAPLDVESTRDFIACVTYGVLTRVFTLKEATSLYYAAQIAHSINRSAAGKTKKA